MPEPQNTPTTPGIPPGFSQSPTSNVGPMPSGDTIKSMAQDHGLDPDIISRQIQQESKGNPKAVSSKGAVGLMQLMPDTAAKWGVNPHDPTDNLNGGMSEMHELLTRFGGDYEKALAAYNAGAGAVHHYNGVPPFPETQKYVSNIMGGGEDSPIPKPATPSFPAGFTASPGEASTPVSKPTATPSVAQDTGVTAAARNFMSEFWPQANPVNLVKGLAHMVGHPVDTLNEDAQQRGEIFDRAQDSFKRGDYAEGLSRLLNYAIPLIGPQAQKANDLQNSGQYSREAGMLTGVAAATAEGKYAGLATDLAAKALQVPADAASYSPRTASEVSTGEGAARPANAAQGAINRSMGAAVRDVRYGDPSRALIDNNISTPTTAGRLKAVTSKINDIAPTLEKTLSDAAQDGEHKPIDVVNTISPIIDKATKAINESFETPEAKLTAHKDLNALWMNSLEMAPDGSAGVDVANKIKQGIGDTVNWEKRPTPMMPQVEVAYRQAYGAFKSQIHGIVPEVADINDNLSNLYSARNALTEQFHKQAAGSGAMTNLGIVPRVEALAGHVAPAAINLAQGVAEVPAMVGRGLGRLSSAMGDLRLSDATNPTRNATSPFVKNPEAGTLNVGNNATGPGLRFTRSNAELEQGGGPTGEFVHLSPVENFDSIKRNGLKPSEGGKAGNGVYGGSGIDYAASGSFINNSELTDGSKVAVRVKPSELPNYKVTNAGEDRLLVNKAIPPEDLEFTKDGKTWQPINGTGLEADPSYRKQDIAESLTRQNKLSPPVIKLKDLSGSTSLDESSAALRKRYDPEGKLTDEQVAEKVKRERRALLERSLGIGGKS